MHKPPHKGKVLERVRRDRVSLIVSERIQESLIGEGESSRESHIEGEKREK